MLADPSGRLVLRVWPRRLSEQSTRFVADTDRTERGLDYAEHVLRDQVPGVVDLLEVRLASCFEPGSPAERAADLVARMTVDEKVGLMLINTRFTGWGVGEGEPTSHDGALDERTIAEGTSIFATRTVQRGSETEAALLATHAKVIEHLGLVRGVSHTEFIRGRDDGKIYFLETAARVGGAHIADLVEASTGINLWREWSKIEISQGESPYVLPPHRADYGGLIISLARQEKPDTSAYTDPELVWRLEGHAAHHVGFIVRASGPERVEALLDDYEPRITRDFMAILPPARTATS